MSDFASEWQPLDEWILVRIEKQEVRAASIALVEKRNGQTVVREKGQRENVGTVVAVGPGEYSQMTGQLVPIDPRIKPGVEVLFAGMARQRPDDLKEAMEREGLWLVTARSIIMARKPAAVMVQ